MPSHQLTLDDRDDVREFIADLSDVHRLAEVFPGVVTPAGIARVLPNALKPEHEGLVGSVAILARRAADALNVLRESEVYDNLDPEREAKRAQVNWTNNLSSYISDLVFHVEHERKSAELDRQEAELNAELAGGLSESTAVTLESAVVEGWSDAKLELVETGPHGHGAVYVITTPDGQYVGQSTQPMPRRWRQHQRAAQAGSHLPVHCALASTLPHLFGCRFEVVEVAESKAQLDEAEQRWIDKLKPVLNSRNQVR